MRQLLLLVLLLFIGSHSYGQAYISMPADSAVWRYRLTDNADYTQVIDNILYTNGKDTSLNGHTYHKVYSRSFNQFGPSGFNPPMVSCYASAADMFYGGIRESGKQVFRISGTGEQMIFDFNANVGDFIPAYSGTVQVTAIDSIWVSGVYHRRYLTTDPGYAAIEGIGSSRGLFPNINGGGSDIAFICLTHNSTTYSPDTSLPCTYVYPYSNLSVSSLPATSLSGINVYPVPASDIIHITPAQECQSVAATVTDCLGRTMWSGLVDRQMDVSVTFWPRGLYFIRFHAPGAGGTLTKKLVIN